MKENGFSAPPTPDTPFWLKLEHAASVWKDVLHWNNREAKPFSKILNVDGSINEQHLLRSVLTWLANTAGIEGKEQATWLPTTRSVGMQPIGGGVYNTVFPYTENGCERPTWAIGIRRQPYSYPIEACDEAARLNKEYLEIRRIYEAMLHLVPTEYNAVYKRHDDKPGTFFVRSYIDGPLQDFFSLPPQKLIDVVKEEPELRESLFQFDRINQEQRVRLLEIGIDFIGMNNLVIAGNPGHRRLSLLEPHCCRPLLEEYKRVIAGRIDYISYIVESLSAG